MGRPRKAQTATTPDAGRPVTVGDHLQRAAAAHTLIRTHTPDESPAPSTDGSPQAAPAQPGGTP